MAISWILSTSNELSMTFWSAAPHWRHADNVLVIVVVGDAMNVHRKGQGLVFRDGGSGGELHTLHAKIKAQHSQVDKGRKFLMSLSFRR